MATLEHYLLSGIAQGQHKTAKKLTAQLRRTAYEYGWPTHAARSLTVVPRGKHFGVEYPDHHATTIENLEYGTQDTPPSPVLRKFLHTLKDSGLHREIHR